MELGVRVICLADENESLFYVYSEESIEINFKNKKMPYAFSLIALEPLSVVSISGAKWNLSYSRITQKHPYAISNRSENHSLKIDVHEGSIGVYAVFNDLFDTFTCSKCRFT